MAEGSLKAPTPTASVPATPTAGSPTVGPSPASASHQSRFASGEHEEGGHLSSFERGVTSGEFDTQRKRTAGGVSSNFIKARTQQDNFHWGKDGTSSDKVRACLLWFVQSSRYANFMAFVVMFDTYCTCIDIDARASSTSPPAVLMLLADLCLVLYTAELVILVTLKGLRVLKDWLVLLDAVIVACGYAEMIANTIMQSAILADSGVRVLRVLRLARMIRLIRLLRKMRELRELQKLVTMMATCLKTLAWSFLFCFVIMTIWAMLMVEMVHPLVTTMHKETMIFDECGEACLKATSSVMHANLLLYKTVIAGDSWGLIAVPVIEEYPATAIIFIGSSLTLVFGVLNLIVAVVVDTFAEARERDVLNLAEEMERNHENDKKFLQKVFERIDEDGSGELTLEELIEGARKDPEFQSRLRVMDIDEADLQQLFEMIDVDGSGAIEAAEFIAPLSRWVHDSKTAPRFIKYNMLRTLEVQEELCRQSHNQFMFLKNELALVQNSIQSASKEPLLLSDAGDGYHVEETPSNGTTDTEPLEFCEPVRHDSILPDIAEELEQPQVSGTPSALSAWPKPPQTGGFGPHFGRDHLRSGKRRVTAPDSAAHARNAPDTMMDSTLEKLEQRLLVAAEGALRRSMGYFEYALQQHLDKMTAAALGPPPAASMGFGGVASKFRGMAPGGRRESFSKDSSANEFSRSPWKKRTMDRPSQGVPENDVEVDPVDKTASESSYTRPGIPSRAIRTDVFSSSASRSKDPTPDASPSDGNAPNAGDDSRRERRFSGEIRYPTSRRAARHSIAGFYFNKGLR